MLRQSYAALLPAADVRGRATDCNGRQERATGCMLETGWHRGAVPTEGLTAMAAKRTDPMADDDPGEQGLNQGGRGREDSNEHGLGEGEMVAPYRANRRTMARVLVPVGVAAVAAASIGLVPALASDAGPQLPHLSADQLVAKALASDVQSLTGTVQATADLGIPAEALGGVAGLGRSGGGPFAHPDGQSGDDGQGDGAAVPQARLTQLLAGTHTLQVSVDGPDRQRVGLIDSLAEYEIVHNGDQVWGWDSRTNEAVHLTLPAGQHTARAGAPFGSSAVPATPQEAAKQFLSLAGPTTAVSVGGTSRVAGQNAYELSVKPKQSGSTIGEVRIAVDSDNGVPLRVRVIPSAGGSAAFDVHFTSVRFDKPGARTFDFTPPRGAKVTEHRATAEDRADAERPDAARHAADGLNVSGQGWTSVASLRLPTASAGADQGALSMVKGLGKPVAGGSLISSRLVNALITDKGTVYLGAVSQQVLQDAAGAR